jgi:hypothetical protein
MISCAQSLRRGAERDERPTLPGSFLFVTYRARRADAGTPSTMWARPHAGTTSRGHDLTRARQPLPDHDTARRRGDSCLVPAPCVAAAPLA